MDDGIDNDTAQQDVKSTTESTPPMDFTPSEEEFLAYAPGDDANHLTKPLILGRKSDARYGRQTMTPRYFLLDLQHMMHLCERRIVLITSAMNATMNHVNGSLDWMGETLVRRYEARAARVLAQWYGASISRKASHLGFKSTAQIVAESKKYTVAGASFMSRFLGSNTLSSQPNNTNTNNNNIDVVVLDSEEEQS